MIICNLNYQMLLTKLKFYITLVIIFLVLEQTELPDDFLVEVVVGVVVVDKVVVVVVVVVEAEVIVVEVVMAVGVVVVVVVIVPVVVIAVVVLGDSDCREEEGFGSIKLIYISS